LHLPELLEQIIYITHFNARSGGDPPFAAGVELVRA
jgi:hypothetical protein